MVPLSEMLFFIGKHQVYMTNGFILGTLIVGFIGYKLYSLSKENKDLKKK